MICRHGGKLTYWFTSDRNDWEIRWCERCGALQKFNLAKKKMEWVFPQWANEYKEKAQRKSFGSLKSKATEKKSKNKKYR